MITTHVANHPRNPAAERAAEEEELAAAQYIGKRVEWDPGDEYGVRVGTVIGWTRYDEGHNRIGALLLKAEREKANSFLFCFPFAGDAWHVIS